jgi:PIN domain nuclease of toxin-antitoxin system
VRVLLDTHTLLWVLAGDERLSATARQIITDETNDILVSVVSAWEMAVKRALGKLRSPHDLERVISEAGFVVRLVFFGDCERLSALPPIHRDPFDRMLVCQALEEGIPIVTRDETIPRYPVQTIW